MPDFSLDGPVVPMAVLALAGTKSKGRQFTGGESGAGLVAAGFAGSSAQYAADEILSRTGMSGTVSSPLGQAVLGAALSKYGKDVPLNAPAARGIHYNVMTNAMSSMGVDLGSLMGSVGGSSTGQSAARSVSKSSSGNASVSRNTPTTRNGGNTVRFG